MRHSFDPKCLELAEYFYRRAEKDRLHNLAQQLQDVIEGFDPEEDPSHCAACGEGRGPDGMWHKPNCPTL